MANIIVTLINNDKDHTHVDLSLPNDVPLRMFLPALLEKLTGHENSGSDNWTLRNQNTGDILDPESSLNDAGTLTGDILCAEGVRPSLPRFPNKFIRLQREMFLLSHRS